MFTTHRKVEAATPPGGTVLDTFTAANGTTIESRSTDSGHTWTNWQGSIAIQDNAAYPAALVSLETKYSITESLSSPDWTCTVEGIHTQVAGYSMSLYFRHQNPDNTVRLHLPVGSLSRITPTVYQIVGGVQTQILAGVNVTVGGTWTMVINVTGNELNYTIDGGNYRGVLFNAGLDQPYIGIGFDSGTGTNRRTVDRYETVMV